MTSLLDRIRAALPLVLTAAATACGAAGEAGSGRSGPEWAIRAAEADDPDRFLRGAELYGIACAACHRFEGAPVAAPVMAGMADHYRNHFASRAEAVEWIADYLEAPSPARSRLDAERYSRFAPMPAFPLPESDLQALAYWMWEIGAGERSLERRARVSSGSALEGCS